MATLFDADGNEVEVPEQEELTALKEKAEKVEGLEETLKAKEEQLTKYGDKEFNFKQFRESEEAKRNEMLEGFSEEKKMLILGKEGTEQQLDELRGLVVGETKESIISQIVGDDADAREKLEALVKEMYPSGVPSAKVDMQKAYKRVALVLQSEQGVNPLSKFSPVTGIQMGENKGGGFVDTPDGKAIVEKKFAKELEKVRKINPDFKL